MKVYQKGIDLFPDVSKLHEDAGVLAGSMGQLEKAILFLTKALELCRTTTQGGEKGVLLALARTHCQRGDHQSLKKAVDFYERARRVSSSRSTGDIPSKDDMAMNLAKIRVQHYRGNLTYNFLTSCGFPIVRAILHQNTTEGADLVVHIDKPEMRESYGISGSILVRCIFKSSFSLKDLNDIDNTIASGTEDELTTDQISFLILASVSDDLQRRLFSRIDDRSRQVPMVIPLPQKLSRDRTRVSPHFTRF